VAARSGTVANALLVPDPCELLDEVTGETRARFLELAKDYDGAGGKITDGSRCEARLALTLEREGVLDGELTRPEWGEALDRHGQAWDFKGPHSREAILAKVLPLGADLQSPEAASIHTEDAFDLETELRRVRAKQRAEFGVVFDLRRLRIEQALELVAAVNAHPDLDPNLVRFFPTDLTPFGAGA